MATLGGLVVCAPVNRIDQPLDCEPVFDRVNLVIAFAGEHIEEVAPLGAKHVRIGGMKPMVGCHDNSRLSFCDCLNGFNKVAKLSIKMLYRGSRRRALTRRLRQVMHDALPYQLPELAVPAPGAELLAVIFLQL